MWQAFSYHFSLAASGIAEEPASSLPERVDDELQTSVSSSAKAMSSAVVKQECLMVVDGEPEKSSKSSKVTEARRGQLRSAEDTRRAKTKKMAKNDDSEKEVRPRPFDY